jgi:hypothetical protein
VAARRRVGGGDHRVVQTTPPRSNASIVCDLGVTYDEPGSIDSLLLAVDDIEAARDELRSQGVDVSRVFHDPGGGLGGGWRPGIEGRAAGLDPRAVHMRRDGSSRRPAGSDCVGRSWQGWRRRWTYASLWST